MHDLSELGGTCVPAFLAKLWKMVEDPETDDLITWGVTGNSFIIMNATMFTQQLLPKYYKHNNLASFVRQLNMYGFHKLISTECGGLKSEKDYMEFSHTCFVKGHPYLMENIKRKMSVAQKTTAPVLAYVKDMSGSDLKEVTQGQLLAQVLSDVNSLKSKQASWDAKLAAMKRENETLWRELAIFRQKHHKQEQIINKLIHFIVTMVQPSARNVNIRRRYPLMLSDVQRSGKSYSGGSSATMSNGPTIRELDPTELLLGEVDGIRGRSGRKRAAEYIVPHSIDDLPQDDVAEFVPSTLVGDSPYVVLSPDNVAGEELTQTTNPPWQYVVVNADNVNGEELIETTESPLMNLDLSDAEGDAMTPVSPMQVNPTGLVTAQQPAPAMVTKAVRPVKAVKRVPKGGAAVARAKTRKNSQPKKAVRRMAVKSSKSLPDETDLLSSIKLEPSPSTSEPLDSSGIKLLKVVPADDEEENPTLGLPEGMAEESQDLDQLSMALVRPSDGYNAEEVARYVSQKDLGGHVDAVQGDIDVLKEFLRNENYSLDASALLELFNDDPLSYNMPPASDESGSKEVTGEDLSGSELMTYGQPTLQDLVDMYATSSSSFPSPPPLSPSPSVLETPAATPLSPPHLAPLIGGKKRRK